MHRVGAAFFAGRWPLLRYSPWNQARSKGLVSEIVLGPMGHTGADGYLSTTARMPDGRSYLDATVDAIAAIVDAGTPQRQAAA